LIEVKRFRIRYNRSNKLKYLSHLDMMRLWPRVFRRAGLDMAYSEGFNAHPRLAVAAPLAVGWTGQAELMEIWLENPPPAPTALGLLAARLPEGLVIDQGMYLPLEGPSLQSMVRFAEYQVDMGLDRPSREIAQSVTHLLGLSTLDWTHQRDDETRRYDLRAQIADISVAGTTDEKINLTMRLKNDPSGSGRPEQVVKALGFIANPLRIHRTRLILA
jgi:radical SAM-linked protein